jgi:hypothetical protein
MCEATTGSTMDHFTRPPAADWAHNTFYSFCQQRFDLFSPEACKPRAQEKQIGVSKRVQSNMHGWCCGALTDWQISGLFLGWTGFYVLVQLPLSRRLQRAIARVCAYRSSRLYNKTPKPHVGRPQDAAPVALWLVAYPRNSQRGVIRASVYGWSTVRLRSLPHLRLYFHRTSTVLEYGWLLFFCGYFTLILRLFDGWYTADVRLFYDWSAFVSRPRYGISTAKKYQR